MKSESNQSLFFFNSPIGDTTADIIGMAPYVEQLNAAIDAGAEVIAVTSPFGAGKTSLIELLKKSRRWQPKNKVVRWIFNNLIHKTVKKAFQKEHMTEISLWHQISCNPEQLSHIQLHKTFVYQLASQILSLTVRPILMQCSLLEAFCIL